MSRRQHLLCQSFVLLSTLGSTVWAADQGGVRLKSSRAEDAGDDAVEVSVSGQITDAKTGEFVEVSPWKGPTPPDSEKAELMGRVEWVSMLGGRDVTARKSIEWGDVERHENGNCSIRYKYYGTVWDKDVYIMNQVFTFDPEGNPVSMRHVDGFPKRKPEKKIDTSTKQGMIELVEDFFTKNFRDVTSRKTIEWGELEKLENGNASIRYKYEATIWEKDTKIINQVFTFDAGGDFVSVADVDGSRKEE